jgi:hypothetical protein
LDIPKNGGFHTIARIARQLPSILKKESHFKVKKILKAFKNRKNRKINYDEELDNFREMVIDLHLKITKLEKENRRLKRIIKKFSEI